MMMKMGFCDKWIKWIMECVFTTTFFVVVKGETFGYFCSAREIRQGDLLSPYLFLLCIEGFFFMLSNAERNGTIQGLKIGRRCPSINHLLFADDSLIFSKAGEKIYGGGKLH
ncbi:hypothetical protein L6164_022890 [Bauhinia variegata]|uniref:Uncharacterized protein n=1 Tax=Bauhinia variegata TaxID=167791 RepID=A0ACB9MJY3_BAUVA|nr:hypothetical protein L6164_022890 [Bauhinia variegata]